MTPKYIHKLKLSFHKRKQPFNKKPSYCYLILKYLVKKLTLKILNDNFQQTRYVFF